MTDTDVTSTAQPSLSYTILLSPTASERAAGAALVELVSRYTGYPDPARYSLGELSAYTTHRQNHAYATLLAQHADGSIIGHLLLEYANAPEWVTYPAVRTAWEEKRLMEIGAGAVHPDYQRRLIATTLMQAALNMASATDNTIVASAWADGPSEIALAATDDWVRLGQHQPPHAETVVTFRYSPIQER